MYGDANALTISRRTIREISAICSTATVTVGRTSDDQVVNPADGRIGMSTAKTVRSIRPVQKSGIDCPAMVTTLAASSRRVSACRAIQTPSGNRNHGGEQDCRDRQGDRVRQPARAPRRAPAPGTSTTSRDRVAAAPEVDAGTARTRIDQGPCRCGYARGPRWWPAGLPSQYAGSPGAIRISTKTVVSVRNRVSRLCASRFAM